MIIISASGNLTIYLASNKSFRRLVFKRYFKCDYSSSIVRRGTSRATSLTNTQNTLLLSQYNSRKYSNTVGSIHKNIHRGSVTGL